ncbi:MAG: hypothetical protein LBQ50_06505 [Planctomycetaceae bacterium]|jgi:hypothetical protein|nr:hypothetical protein [Planctomycetaceae bacterium]
MDLDVTGWPELPRVGLKIKFYGGDILYQCSGVCTIVRSEHTRNAAGKPGGRVWLRTSDGEVFSVPLSQVRNHAEVVGNDQETDDEDMDG